MTNRVMFLQIGMINEGHQNSIEQWHEVTLRVHESLTLYHTCSKHNTQLSFNTATELVETTHNKIWWPRIRKLYHAPHILNCLEITRRGKNKI